MITSKADYSGEHTMPLTINVSAPATGLSSYTICGSNNSRVASHLQLLDLSNGTGLQLAIVSTQSQPDLVRLGYDSGNLTIDLCLTDNGFNKTSMYNSSLYTSLHTASARHTIILPLEEVLSSCTLPTVPRNGQVSARWLLYNESLNFTCNDGYYLTGPANVTCLDDGNVTDSARTDCLPVNCTRPSTPKNGQLSQSPLNYEQPLTISCNTGYRLTGPSSVRCLANSASTGSSMTFCVAVNCTPPSAPENAKISEGPFNFEQPLIISCNSGYGLTGPSSVRCLANGTSTNSSKSSCVDMDECRLPAPVCHSKGATCTNTIGNFSCTCSFGYSGDGFICEEVENCSPGMCDSRANCTSVIGSVYCRCHAGYTGSGWPGSCFILQLTVQTLLDHISVFVRVDLLVMGYTVKISMNVFWECIHAKQSPPVRTSQALSNANVLLAIRHLDSTDVKISTSVMSVCAMPMQTARIQPGHTLANAGQGSLGTDLTVTVNTCPPQVQHPQTTQSPSAFWLEQRLPASCSVLCFSASCLQ
eukprot:scpid46987/ scgid1521/ Sushi, von Willebrand factor type A, EGF and pentraxin domain-containing protein 1; Polydom